MTLKQDIDAFTAETSGRLPPELLAELRKSVDDVRQSGIVDRALTTGDIAPDFTLPNAVGRPVALADLLRRGPLIVSFYRGVGVPTAISSFARTRRSFPRFAQPAATSSLFRLRPPTIHCLRRRRTV